MLTRTEHVFKSDSDLKKTPINCRIVGEEYGIVYLFDHFNIIKYFKTFGGKFKHALMPLIFLLLDQQINGSRIFGECARSILRWEPFKSIDILYNFNGNNTKRKRKLNDAAGRFLQAFLNVTHHYNCKEYNINIIDKEERLLTGSVSLTKQITITIKNNNTLTFNLIDNDFYNMDIDYFQNGFSLFHCVMEEYFVLNNIRGFVSYPIEIQRYLNSIEPISLLFKLPNKKHLPDLATNVIYSFLCKGDLRALKYLCSIWSNEMFTDPFYSNDQFGKMKHMSKRAIKRLVWKKIHKITEKRKIYEKNNLRVLNYN
jgi:hypothetical protein